VNSTFPFAVLLAALATWRVTHLLNAEDGPFDLFVRLRRWAGKGFFAELLDCFYCLSIWVAVPFAAWLGNTWGERLLLWLALSSAAILIQVLVLWAQARTPPAARYEEDPEE
jgi:type VI protein secretion system component VasK